MEKLQWRLLVLIALGTISRSEEVDRPHPDSVAVMSSATPPLGCGPPKSVNVRFNDIKVKGPDSDVVYHRVTVRDEDLQFAMNTSVSLPSDSFLECAKAAASEGSDAFTFEGSCTGYLLNSHFLKCQAGDLVVFVRAAYLDDEPAVVPFDEAPYQLVDDGDVDPYRVYRLSALVETVDEHPTFLKMEQFEGDMIQKYNANFIFRENGDVVVSSFFLLDLDSCLNKGAYGLEVVVHPKAFDIKRPYLNFFEECGNKVPIPESEASYKMLIFSHPGVGCKYYPSGLPDECTVTFEKEDSSPVRCWFGFFFSDNSDDGGLIMTINGSSPQTGKTETRNFYNLNYYGIIHSKVTYEVSLLRHPSKRALGFFIMFF